MGSGRGRNCQLGFTYLAVMVVVALLGAGLAAYGEAWSRARERERVRELAWIGGEFRDAIGLYYERSPGGAKRYPENLDALLEDRRYPSRQRYLRRIYADPFSGRSDWGLVFAPQGGVMGVYSRAAGKEAGEYLYTPAY